jgi:ABC-2 type transport system permease protein
MKELVTLVRREFWEHRVLVSGPAIMCALYLVLCLLVGARLTPSWFIVDGFDVSEESPMSPVFYMMLNVVFTLLLYGLMGVVGFFYLCDCLYSERKDRSILFWKSMPVSDSMTVLSKLLVGLIGIPLVVFGLALITNVVAYLVFKVTLDHGGALGPPAAGRHWAGLDWLQLEALLLMDVFILALWYAPIAAYQMLVSVAVPRSAMVWTVLPPLVLIFGQKLLFNSWTIASFTGDRLGTVVTQLPSRGGDGVAGLLDKANLIGLLTFPSLWIGVAVAALMLYVTIRIRRHRDDT